MISIMDGGKESVLAEVFFSTFEALFRKKGNTLSHLTENFNGIKKSLTDSQMHDFKTIVESFVEFCCSENNPKESVLLALKSLKWLYRGREAIFIKAIDTKRIWEANRNVKNNQEVMSSLFELIEILINFITGKISENT